MRITSDLWVSVLFQRVRAQDCYAYLLRRGEESAGAIFLSIYHKNTIFLYSPAPQLLDFDALEIGHERSFNLIYEGTSEEDVAMKIHREIDFDPDIWHISIEIIEKKDHPSFDHTTFLKIGA